MKSLLISTAIILAIGLGGSFLYRAFTGQVPRAAAETHHQAGDTPVGWYCGGAAKILLVPA